MFNEVKSVWEPLSIPVPPNIWTELDTNPLGSIEPVGIVTVLPLDIVSWSPEIVNSCESVSDVK